MNRTITGATVKRCDYDTHDQLRTHLTDFMAAQSFIRQLDDWKATASPLLEASAKFRF